LSSFSILHGDKIILLPFLLPVDEAEPHGYYRRRSIAMLTLRQIEVIRAIMVTGTVGGAARVTRLFLGRRLAPAEPVA
jgi:hypothetical protein